MARRRISADPLFELLNAVPPILNLPAHSALFDILFLADGSFPTEMADDAIVTFHVPWNRSPATRHKVVRLPFDSVGMPTGDVEPLSQYAGGGDTGSDWPHRPVGLVQLPQGALLVTSDGPASI